MQLKTAISRNSSYLVIIILVLAFFVRIYSLTGFDMVIDDSLNSFRAIGYFDFLAADNKQSTPVSWFEEAQWWQMLSFHDHPPVNFIIQFVFFKVLGDTVFAARLPFVLAGVASVFFLFLVGKKLFNLQIGLIAALVLAVMNYHVWISRIGYLESLLIFFLISSLYYFILAQDNRKYYLVWGLLIGLGVATKYTFILIFPVYFFYLLLFKRQEFKNKFLYFGLAILAVIISPVVLYNIMVFITRGHFDAALSSMLGMHPEDYRSLTRSVGGGGNIANIFKSLASQLSLASIGIIILSSIHLLFEIIKHHKWRKYYFLISYLVFSLIIFVLADTHVRFVSVLTPILALIIGIGIYKLYELLTTKKIFSMVYITMVGIFFVYEGIFAFNTQTQPVAFGNEKIHYASFRPVFFGYKQLDDYLGNLLINAQPENLITFYDIPQVVEKQKNIFDKAKIQQSTNQILVVYDDRIDWFAQIWLFERRKLYDLQAMGTVSLFWQALEEGGQDFFQSLGFKEAYFIIGRDDLFLANVDEDTNLLIQKTREQFRQDNILPSKTIINSLGKEIFDVYQIDL